MNNPRWSKVKRLRKSGFRTRMKTKNGRKILSRKRRVGRSVNIVQTQYDVEKNKTSSLFHK